MDRQRNETARLDHESKSTIPMTLSKWFIEDDAAYLFTRAIFYKVQEEILASCLKMQIKHVSEEIDGVTHMEIRDVRVKDKLFKVSLKLTNIWFDFRQTVDKAGVHMDRLDYVHKTIKQLNTDLGDDDVNIVEFTKKDHMEAMVGQKPS
ncbi:hypothetical protein POM88_007471 [Heracleum sosnowskyi]|uniref:Uncharacterized protein n=1 Tax=Heracleum sosnowskyi TaxID=360622 RepID=A0AAD8N7L0_9APIA|nr:hypothetical protein POM88_007471 [Heracleum sosnowskyi]